MTTSAAAGFQRLVEVMGTLRSPNGCPWDREQTLASLRPFVLEETYELLEALDRGDMEALKEELGDFLYEAVFLAQICEEEGHFTMSDVVQSIADKLVRRHPHVFTPKGEPLAALVPPSMTASQVVENWEDHKARERATAGAPNTSILSGVPRTLPALLRAYELGARAAAVGFDWPEAKDVVDKIEEEVRELRDAVNAAESRERVEEEMGDLLFAVANLARKRGIEPESALRRANDKFQNRFGGLERQVASEGRSLRGMTLDEMEQLWGRLKSS